MALHYSLTKDAHIATSSPISPTNNPTNAATPTPTNAATPNPTNAATPNPTNAATPDPTNAATPNSSSSLAYCVSLFDPNSMLTGYIDDLACGPRGDDAGPDASDCPNGAATKVCGYDGISIGWQSIIIDNCGYFKFEVYQCVFEP